MTKDAAKSHIATLADADVLTVADASDDYRLKSLLASVARAYFLMTDTEVMGVLSALSALTGSLQPSDTFAVYDASSSAWRKATINAIFTYILNNDGHGSGLNADYVDGIEGSAIVQTSRTISTSSGLTGGGDLSANRTLSVDFDALASLTLGALAKTDEFILNDVSAGAPPKRFDVGDLLWSGVYTPTFTNIANVSSFTTSYQAKWLYVGDMVFHQGLVDLTPTSATLTRFRVSMDTDIDPASGFASAADATGVAASRVDSTAGQVIAHTSTNQIEVQFTATSTTNRTVQWVSAWLKD